MLQGLEVVDCSRRIAGAYCSHLFADAGARVVVVEPPGGHPLRTWTATGADLAGRDGALFRFLAAGWASTVTADGLPTDAVLAGAHLLVETGEVDVAAVRTRHPHLVVVSITPYGRTGPHADRPAAEFTVQAESGSIAYRGLPNGIPVPGRRAGQRVVVGCVRGGRGAGALAGAGAAAPATTSTSRCSRCWPWPRRPTPTSCTR